MALVSPCRRTPNTMPSSVHSMRRVYRISLVGAAVSTPSFRGDAKHRTRNLEISGFAAFDAPRNDEGYALNQPRASPVKEKYSPAAVSAQETISMPLSNCSPLSPIICTSEMTESTREATSAQRGQFLRRCAASQTKYTSNRIKQAAITVATVIIDPVLSTL